MKNIPQNGAGLVELTPDSRDFSLGGFTRLPKLEELPEEFVLPYTVKNQFDSDYCTGFASCAVSEVQEGEELDPAYSFAASKEITKDVEQWGQNLRDMCKGHVKHGAIAVKDVPTLIHKLPYKDRRHWKYWEGLRPLASKHKKKSYFATDGQYDTFDNIRASMWKYKIPVMTGIKFGYPLKQVTLDEITDGFGHSMATVGWTKNHLIILNSYGKKAGDKGVHYVSREVINHWASKFGAYTFIDADPEDVKWKQSHNLKDNDNWIVQLWKILLNILNLR